MFYHHYFFNFFLEYAIRKVHKKQQGLKLNGTHHITVYTDNDNLPGEPKISRSKTKGLSNAGKEVGL
jgi:hypothetical protein